ncbi:AGAP000784-PA [Anopheles gambiae str. PEST]|uniref:1-acylglycerol-3-phosphate O-acyltransferase ABHD5 n=3 Tax=gambiae species complex TaxID=44542 RepID=Q7QE79_ANOGA|nr:(Lyso)-N-acylphosphatidylethanolamine lipase-like [Anopheles coluzzii]XP_311323.4 (Lyso)-N-acylphosphatidylethanolamine lipase [Anopheles gambiae]EAA06898.4 AGAP000784-PA [Anopheles gambiae str. PEST]
MAAEATATAPTAAFDQASSGSESSLCAKDKGWFNWWTGTSFDMLRALEKRILSYLKTPYRGSFVDVGHCVGEADKIWTLSLNTESPNVPLVLVHGLGAGVALWVLNLDALARERPVYAIDVLGFGRSSRPRFSTDPMVVEKQLVKSIEEWRREMNLQEMILLGHSMGGFIAASYALSYPDRLRHLILADPWGMPEKPKEFENNARIRFWLRPIFAVSKMLNPLWPIRFAGPYGPSLVSRFRQDIVMKFSNVITDGMDISNYIHQCNSQNPTGEGAFHSMMQDFAWAKNPMLNRIGEMKRTVPVTVLYGSKSWLLHTSPPDTIKQLGENSFVNVRIIEGSGHHIYADDADTFNRMVNEACQAAARVQPDDGTAK